MLGLNIEVSSVCGVLAAMGILLPGNDIAASALVPLNESKNKSIKRHSRNGVKVVLKTDDKDTEKSTDKSADKDKISSKSVSTDSGSISDSVNMTATATASSSSSSSSVISNMSSNMVISDVVLTVGTVTGSSAVTVNKNDITSSVTEGGTESNADKDKESAVMMDVVEDVQGADVTVRSNSAVVEMISEVSCSVDDAVVKSSSDSTTQNVCQGNHTDSSSSKNSHDNSNNNSSSSSSTGGVSGVACGNDDCVSLLPHTHNESSSSVSATVSMDVVETPHHSSIFLHKTDLSSICTDTASDSSGAISERMEERSVSQSQNSVSELHDKMSSSELKDFGVLLSESGVKEGIVKVEKVVTVPVAVAVEHVTIPTMTEDVKMDVDNEIETETEVESDEENGNDSSDNAGEGVLEFLEKRWGDLLLNYLKEEEVRSKLRIQQENAFAAAAAAAGAATTTLANTTTATAVVPSSFSRQISTDIIDVDDLKYMGGIPTNPSHNTVHTNNNTHGLENGNMSGNGTVGGGVGNVIDQNPDPLFEYSTTFSPTNDISNSLFLFAPGELEDAFPATPILTLSPIIINNMLTVANPVPSIPDITFPTLKGNSTADISYKAQNNTIVQPVKSENETENGIETVSVPFTRNKMDTENDGNTDEMKDIQNDQMIINEESNSSDENFSNLLQSTIVDTFLEKSDGNHFIPSSKEIPIFPSTFSTENGIGEEKNEISDFECVFSTTPGSSFYEIDSKNMSIESKVQNEESYRDLISSFLHDNSENDNIEINNENGNNNNNSNNNDTIINGNHNNHITSIIDNNISKIISDSKIPCNTILKNGKNAAKRTSNQRLWKINPSLFPKQSKQFQTHTTKTNLINTNTTMTEFYNNGISSENGKISNGIKQETVHNREESKNENVNDMSIKKEICTKSENIVSTYACVPAHSETVNGNLHINGNGNGNGNGTTTLINKDVVMTVEGKNESEKVIVNSKHKKSSNSIKEKKKILKSSKELKKVLMEPENVLSGWMDACYEEACAAELEESIIRRCVCVCVSVCLYE